jgi:hypothetical protein
MGRIFNEPVLLAGAIRAVLYSAMLFGLNITEQQLGGVILAVEAVSALITRTFVTSEKLINERVAEGRHPFTGEAK